MRVDLPRQQGIAAIGSFGQAFRLDGATQQSGILSCKLSDPKLHVVDDSALFSDLLLHAADAIGSEPAPAGPGEVVEDVAMVGVDGIAPDARLAGERGDG